MVDTCWLINYLTILQQIPNLIVEMLTNYHLSALRSWLIFADPKHPSDQTGIFSVRSE